MNTKNRWSERIRALQSVGLSYGTIGELIGLSSSSIADLASGRTRGGPCGDAAVALYNLHRKRCGPLPAEPQVYPKGLRANRIHYGKDTPAPESSTDAGAE